MSRITVRWFPEDHETSAKYPKIKLWDNAKIHLPWCCICRKRPPEIDQFIVISGSAYCHSCLKQSMKEVEETDAACTKNSPQETGEKK